MPLHALVSPAEYFEHAQTSTFAAHGHAQFTKSSFSLYSHLESVVICGHAHYIISLSSMCTE